MRHHTRTKLNNALLSIACFLGALALWLINKLLR